MSHRAETTPTPSLLAAERLISEAESERDRYKAALLRIAASVDPRTESATAVARAALKAERQ